MSRSAVAQKRNIAKKLNENLVAEITDLIYEYRSKGFKRSREYAYLKSILVPRGYKPFDIFATYNYVAGSTKGDWEGSVRLAAYVANRR